MHLDSYTCALCNTLAEETLEHLLLSCPFAGHCWNLVQVDIPLQSSFPGIIDQIKDQLILLFHGSHHLACLDHLVCKK